MSTLFVEAFGGMAGDMFLAALLDLGDPRFRLEDLERLADALVGGECRLVVERVWRGSLSGLHLDVRTAESASPPHRRLADLVELIDRARARLGGAQGITERVRERALAALRRLAEAEARVHDTTPEEIHFHEVGAVDTLVDVVGAAFALERLGVERLLASPPLVGSGTVRCAHGEMPVPAPAVAELLRGKPVRLGGGGERLTPTAAAILASWAAEFVEPPRFRSQAVGYGAGTRDPREGPPNILRVQLGSSDEGVGARTSVHLLEVNLDDASGEEVGHVVRRLREAGALDVWTSPLQMKKDRPGVLLSALARAEQRERLEALVFEWTPSLGLRWSEVLRRECERRELVVELEGWRIRVKLRLRPDYPGASPLGERDLSPEHDDLAAAAEALGMGLREVERRAVELALAELRRSGLAPRIS